MQVWAEQSLGGGGGGVMLRLPRCVQVHEKKSAEPDPPCCLAASWAGVALAPLKHIHTTAPGPHFGGTRSAKRHTALHPTGTRAPSTATQPTLSRGACARSMLTYVAWCSVLGTRQRTGTCVLQRALVGNDMGRRNEKREGGAALWRAMHAPALAAGVSPYLWGTVCVVVHRFCSFGSCMCYMGRPVAPTRRSNALLVVLAEAAAGALAHECALHGALQKGDGAGGTDGVSGTI